ncbi:MAG: class I SAM-dependent methyltransferase [Rhodospirillales bacterium]
MTLWRLDMCAHQINRQYSDYTLLDIGCRTKDLAKKLTGCRKYVGTDFDPGEDIVACNIQEGLPFEDNAFDIVVALDVLEHLDDPHRVMPELFRVARQAVFISLPNQYHIKYRWNFLRGRGVSGKYTFPAEPVRDRHRWLLSRAEAIAFVAGNASGHALVHEDILMPRGIFRQLRTPIDRLLAKIWPNLFVHGVLFNITLANK